MVPSLLPLKAVPRAVVNRETTRVFKLVADEATGELLGAHLLAEGAGEVIQAAVMALRHRATVDELAEEYHPYLTMAEGLKLAAQGFRKDVRLLSCWAAWGAPGPGCSGLGPWQSSSPVGRPPRRSAVHSGGVGLAHAYT